MEKVLATIVFVAVLCFAMAVYDLARSRREHRKRKLLDRLQCPVEDLDTFRLKADPVPTPLGRLGGRIVDPVPLQNLLKAAGVGVTVVQFQGICLGAALLMALPAILLLHKAAVALPMMFLGAIVPWLHLRRRRSLRQQALVRQLPDTLEMIVRAVRAGQSVDGALREIAATSQPPVGTEFRLVYEEMAMGLSFVQAMRNFEQRFDAVPDIKIICTAFIVQRETGGNLTKILAGLADTIRQRFQLQRQVRALTAEGRTSALILGLLPIFLVAVFWFFNPDYIGQLLGNPLGRKLLALAAALVATGFGVMRMMTRIEA